MRKSPTAIFVFLLLFGATAAAVADATSTDSLVSLAVTPRLTIPVGRDSSLYTVGGGLDLSGDYHIPFLRALLVGADVGYTLAPVQAATSVSMFEVSVCLGFTVEVLPRLSIRTAGNVGYFYALINDGSERGGSNPCLAASLGAAWAATSTVDLGFEVRYRNFLGLYNDLSMAIGASYRIPYIPKATQAGQADGDSARPQPLETKAPSTGAGIIVESVTLENVFPVQHAYYDTHPVGTVTLKNAGDQPATGITVSLLVQQFMDAPKECGRIAELKPGQEQTLPLFALFSNTILETKQSTKVAAEIAVDYSVVGASRTSKKVETLRVYDRNALSWDDTDKAASFVMPKEPAVLLMSNQVNALVKASMNRAVDHNLQFAMAIHDSLRLMNIAYVSPPMTSYASRSLDKTAVDSVKFPLETIEHHSGDCSDLSVLYCSLLESVQIETAFITVPGHIFMAFALAVPEASVRSSFASLDDFIFRDGQVWVPVETTERNGSFIKAWEGGARQWRTGMLNGTVGFHPVREAWRVFEPVNYPGTGSQPTIPEGVKLTKDFEQELQALVSREATPRENGLLAACKRAPSSAKPLNNLGVLYARWGLVSKAEAQFQQALKKQEYGPSLVNLGNVCLSDSRFAEALAYYGRASKVAPRDPYVLLGLARAGYELMRFEEAKQKYDELVRLAPELARKYAYLGAKTSDSARAAQSGDSLAQMSWEESN